MIRHVVFSYKFPVLVKFIRGNAAKKRRSTKDSRTLHRPKVSFISYQYKIYLSIMIGRRCQDLMKLWIFNFRFKNLPKFALHLLNLQQPKRLSMSSPWNIIIIIPTLSLGQKFNVTPAHVSFLNENIACNSMV